MSSEKNQPSLASLFSSSTILSDIFSVCCSCFPRIRSRVNNSVNEAQPQANQTKWMDDLKEKRINFLSELFEALKDQSHTDTLLKPSDGGPSIPAHRVFLATKSEIFKGMLDSDHFNPQDAMRVPELNSEELKSLLEFLYSGNLQLEKLKEHVYALFVASEKYEIPFLQEFCQSYMLNSLDESTVLDVLETAEVCSNKALKETALNFIIFNNTRAIVSSDKYEGLVAKYPQLSMQITREFFIMNDKNEKHSLVRLIGFHKKTGSSEKSGCDLQASNNSDDEEEEVRNNSRQGSFESHM